ncbi:MAG: hypothetical protein JNM27_09835 [Leptospirales bacterium]|nr:hypothetical protein [Leptospirales bacterium]
MDKYTEDLKKKADRARVSQERRADLSRRFKSSGNRILSGWNELLERQNSEKGDRIIVWWRLRTVDPVIGMFVLSAIITHLILTLTTPLEDFRKLLHRGSLADYLYLAVTLGGFLFIGWAAVDVVRFKLWRRSLGFRLVGWADLVDDAQLELRQWRACSIRIELKSETNDSREAVKALSQLFALEANKSYYAAESESDARRREAWIASEEGLSGSVNLRVAWKVYKFLSGPVKKYQKARGAIDTVRIELKGESFYVSAPSAD